jgi:nicotinate phosphoribosyltransferase
MTTRLTPGALSTDLYELTMAAGYHAAGNESLASFELFVRELPDNRAFLVAAGLEQALEYLHAWRFSQTDIDYLRSLQALSGASPVFFDTYLPNLRFTGDVWAVPEGVPVFAGEPLLRVTAPVVQAQLVETALLSTMLFQTSVASTAARVVEASGGRPVVEFGGRRAHGPEAAVHAARAAYLAGCHGTSNVEAGSRFGIPVSGTMAHSWVMAHSDELSAFTRYIDVHGPQSVLLIDTYDAVAAARLIVRAGLRPAAVRVDSGDLADLSVAVRRVLDAGALEETHILVSGDLDEHAVASLVASGAPIHGFGVGTAISTSAGAPSLGGVYKLVAIERDGAMMPVGKRSPGKRTVPGEKQVWRVGSAGAVERDVIGLADEPAPPDGLPVLRRVMRQGVRVSSPRTVHDLREDSRRARAALPLGVRRRSGADRFPVTLTLALRDLAEAHSSTAEGPHGLSTP